MKKLAVCEYCGNIFMMGDRIWKYRGDKFCSEDCARKAEYLGKQGKWKNDIDKKEKENKEMKEIKLTIDGKEVQLTEEQLRLLGIGTEEKRKSSFDRVTKGEPYCYIDAFDRIQTFADNREDADNTLFEASNYFNDKTTAQQVRLHQLLYRKLLKFAYEHGYEDTTEWNSNNPHWCISYSAILCEFRVDVWYGVKFPWVWFSSPEGANRAIEEVLKPFVRKHPEFEW